MIRSLLCFYLKNLFVSRAFSANPKFRLVFLGFRTAGWISKKSSTIPGMIFPRRTVCAKKWKK